MIPYIVSVFVFTDPKTTDTLTLVATFYMQEIGFTVTLWLARASILFTIIRIAQVEKRRFLYFAAGLFAVMASVLAAQKFWICETAPANVWKLNPLGLCTMGIQTGIAELVTDLIADTILIEAPIRLLWGSHMLRRDKIRLLSVFSTSVVITIIAIVQDIFIFTVGGRREHTSGITQTGVSLVICNLTVLVTAFFRHKAAWGLGGAEDLESRNPNATNYSMDTRSKQQAHTIPGHARAYSSSADNKPGISESNPSFMQFGEETYKAQSDGDVLRPTTNPTFVPLKTSPQTVNVLVTQETWRQGSVGRV